MPVSAEDFTCRDANGVLLLKVLTTSSIKKLHKFYSLHILKKDWV